MIKVKLAGAVKHYGLYKLLMNTLKQYQHVFQFTVYDAPNLCKWNAGRISRDITITPEMVKYYNDNGIGVSFAFSNNIVDVNDPTGNYLLEMLDHNPLNSIILINEDLRQYIRSKYPEYGLTFSITGHPNNIQIESHLIKHYKDLEEKYDAIVPRFEMVFDPKFLANTDASKYEPMTNDTCVHGCKILQEHMTKIAEMNRIYDNPWEEMGHTKAYKVEECWIKSFDPDYGSQADRDEYGDLLGMDFTHDMYKKALAHGYGRFKIMGRELGTLELKEEIETNLKLLFEAYREL